MSAMIVVGIDPGLSGALCSIPEGDEYPQLHDMPTLREGAKGKRTFNEAVLRAFFESHRDHVAHVFMEKVHSMPKQGVASSFNFGMGFGLIKGMVCMARLPLTLVTPQAWKKAMLAGMPKGKESSIIRAQQLFPEADITLKKHEARAEALLIAEYGRRLLGGAA